MRKSHIKNRHLFASIALLYAVLGAPVAHAGQLFPPANLASAASSCAAGSFLFWTGSSVTCQAINISCASGQYLTGIVNGAATCQAIPTPAVPVTTASAYTAPTTTTASGSYVDPAAVDPAAPTTTTAAASNLGTMYSYVSPQGTLTNTTTPCSYCGTMTSQAPISAGENTAAVELETGSTVTSDGGVINGAGEGPGSCYGAGCGYEAAAASSGLNSTNAAGAAGSILSYENMGLSEAAAIAKTNAYYNTNISVPASQ